MTSNKRRLLRNENGELVYDARSLDLEEVSVSHLNLEDVSTTSPELLPSSKFVNITQLILDHNDLKALPDEIGEMKTLKKLSIIGNELCSLPDSTGDLGNLIELYLDENELRTLPLSMCNLEKLEIFSAIANKFTSFQENIFSGLLNLKKLCLDENKLYSLPNSFGQMASLQWFECSENIISKLPESFGNLRCLEVLNLDSNKLSSLPSSFSLLPNLKVLLLSNNNISHLPSTMASSRTIEKLSLDNNDICELPKWLNELQNIQELSVSDNELVDKPFTDNFCSSALKLTSLFSGRNYISMLPENIGMLEKLTHLHLGSTMFELERSNFQSGNWISRIPESFVNLVNLKKLHLDENQIDELPSEIGNLVNLEWFDLGQNQLQSLPDSICDLIKLTYLQVSKNKLKYLPEKIGNLANLIELRLDSNLIAKLPLSLVKIKGLQALDLFDNNLSEFPEALLSLTNLKRLDLDGNNFSTDIIPRILPTNSYPERDEALKDNWRGKTRADKIKCQVIEIPDLEIKDNDIQEEEEVVCFNDSALRNAMRAGMALWRKHDGSGERETFSKNKEQKTFGSNQWGEPSWMIDSSDEIPTKPTLNPVPQSNFIMEESMEDWDEELRNEYYQDTINVCNSRKNVSSALIDSFQNNINRYPPCRFAFSQTACYDSLVYKKTSHNGSSNNTIVFSTEDDQFADAED